MRQLKIGSAAGAAGILGWILLFAAAAPRPAFGNGRPFPQEIEWKIKVTVDKAAVRAAPDPESPVLARVGQGTILISNYAEGAWFRVSVPSEKGGLSIRGFLSTGEVEILEEKDWSIDPAEKPFFGLGLHIGICGGFSTIPNNDLIIGSQGLFEEGQEFLLSQGYRLSGLVNDPFPIGYVFDLGMSYELGPRFGIQGGLFLQSERKSDFQTFDVSSQMGSQPDFTTLGLRIGAYADIPLGGRFHLRLSAEPALIFATFSYSRNQIEDREGYEETKLIHVDKTLPAFLGSIGLEAAVNNRIDIFVAGRGRWSRGSSLKAGLRVGWTLMTWVKDEERTDGLLYLVPASGSPRLAVYPAGTAPAGSREAVLNLSGLDVMAGLRMKF